MDTIDAKVFSLITLGTTTLVGAIKGLFPKWVDGKEEALSHILPVLFTIIAKVSGAFHGTDWVTALLLALGGGIAAQVVHDKTLDPVVKGVKRMRSKAAPTE